jgi:hypothetical protein
MNSSRLLLLAAIAALSGCATGYTLVPAGPVTIQNLHVNAAPGWNLAPGSNMNARANTQVWTQDGLLLNRMVFVPAVSHGEALIRSPQKDAALPVFRKDMLPNEIEELAESTFVKLYGDGNAVINTSNLRPHRFGDTPGVMFDVDASVTESPDYKGLVGAFISGEQLYFMYYLAAEPHYFGKHREAAEAMIKSAHL